MSKTSVCYVIKMPTEVSMPTRPVSYYFVLQYATLQKPSQFQLGDVNVLLLSLISTQNTVSSQHAKKYTTVYIYP